MKEYLSGIKHPAYRDALALTRQGGRAATGRFLVEDLHLVRQALESAEVTLFGVFATPECVGELEDACEKRRVPLYVAGGGLVPKLIGTAYETAVTAIAVVAQRKVDPLDLLDAGADKSDSLILCGDRIQDPRNVGVLVRTADAIGASGLLLCAESAEAWSRQAVRSTTGSILRLPIAIAEKLPDTLVKLKEQGARIVGSSGSARTLARDADLSVRPLVLVVGNEQHGISEKVESVADEVIKLPMSTKTRADSYNVTVAAGMLLYEAKRASRS